MVNYNELKPGMYIQRGSHIKAISNLPWLDGTEAANQSAAQLAATVSWVFIALEERRAQLDEIASVTTWAKGDVEYKDVNQFGYGPHDELPRNDMGLQLYRQTYYHKTQLRGKSFRLDWLDPGSMTPDTSSYNGELRRYDRYWRTVKAGNRTERRAVSADSLIIISRKGLNELDGSSPAGTAIRTAAQIMRSIDQMQDDHFDHNGMGAKLIVVPTGTPDAERTRLRSFFERRLNSLRGKSPKVLPVSADVQVIDLTFPLNTQDIPEISDRAIDAILLANGVPVSLRVQTANVDTSAKGIKFVRTMVGRAELIARAINSDPDIQRSGFYLKVNSDQLEAMQAGELLKAEALQRLTGAPVMSVNEARERLNLEPMPNHDNIVLPQQGFGLLPSPDSNVPDASPSKAYSTDLKALREFVKNGKHYSRKFNSNELSQTEIAMVIDELDPHYRAIVTAYP